MPQNKTPFSGLDPDCILAALDSIDVRSDGLLLALNSYENRVYQVGIEDSMPLVVKFYRPERWTDAAILEEHAFVRELAETEIPVVPALAGKDDVTLHRFSDFRFSIFQKYGGRAPELDRAGVLGWLGRFIGRIHAIGALSSFEQRPRIDIDSFGMEPSDFLLANGFIPAELEDAYRAVIAQALVGVRHSFERAGKVTTLRLLAFNPPKSAS